MTTLDSLTDVSQRETALKLIRESYDRDDSATVEGGVIRGARAKILGEVVPLPTFEPVTKTADRRAFETLSKAWLTWAAGGDPNALLQLDLKSTEFGGALHLMALEPWGLAIRALTEKRSDEALRWFRRSIELGVQYEIETTDCIQWTYAASFWA